MILHTRTHLISRADNIEPKKGRLGLQKWLKTGKNVIFCNYSSKFDRPAHPYGHQILVAPPMEGCNRVLGSHLRRNVTKEKTKIII